MTLEKPWTPGPWKVDTPYDNDITSTVGGGDICTTLNVEIVGRELTVADTVKATREQAWANARLIAAAPDLYEALAAILADCGETATDGYVENSLYHTEVDAARAALAKANGETAA